MLYVLNIIYNKESAEFKQSLLYLYIQSIEPYPVEP